MTVSRFGRYLFRALWLIVWTSFLSLTTAMAHTPADVVEPIDTSSFRLLNEVFMVASRSRFNVASPMPVQSLKGDYLKNLNSLSVADAMRYLSGVQLKDYGGVGGLKTVNVRSLGSAHTAVFYDGMPVSNAQNGQVDLSKFSLDNIEEIQLYNGQKSTIFQPAKGFFASNTLFLKSRTPSFSEGDCYHGNVGIKAGSFGLFNPSVSWEQKISSVFSLAANAEYLTSNGEYKYRYTNGVYDTTATRTNGDIEAERAELTLFARWSPTGNASLKAYIYNSERGLPGAVLANNFNHHQRQSDRNIFVHGMAQQVFGDKYELLFNLKYSHDYLNYVDPEYMSSSNPINVHYDQDEIYVSLVNLYRFTTWYDMSLAADFSANTMAADVYRFPYPTRYSYLGVLSADLHWERLSVQASAMACYVDDQVEEYASGDSRAELLPVISASLQPFNSKTFRLRAFYKQSFRMPTFSELYYTIAGNTSLKPEYTTQYDVGATWILNTKGLFTQFSVQGDVYYNRVKDKIVAMPAANLFRWTMMNLGETEITGVEVNTNTVLHPLDLFTFTIGLNYTYQQAIDVTKGSATYGNQIPYTPHHSGSATLAALWRAWSLNYSFIYTGERYSQKANIPENYMQPFYTSDVALGWQFRYKKINSKINVEVNNIFNQNYDVVRNFPMPGRSFRIALSVEI